MKRFITLILVMLELAMLSEMAHADDYLTIKELCGMTPIVWQGTYEADEIGTVSVDVPIILSDFERCALWTDGSAGHTL